MSKHRWTSSALAPNGGRRPAARDRLIEEHLPLVGRLARRFARGDEELDDLIQVGSIGLINAVDRFKASRGGTFEAYAIPSIVGEIRRHLRDRSTVVRVPRRVQAERAELRRAEHELTRTLGRFPSRRELAARVDVPLPEVELALASDNAKRPISLAGAEAQSPDEMRHLDVWRATDDRIAVQMAFRCLGERDRLLLERRFFDDLSQGEIAREIGISQVQVSRLISSALNRLRPHLDDRPVVRSHVKS